MTPEQESELKAAIVSGSSLDAIYEMLKNLKQSGATQADVQSALEEMNQSPLDEATKDPVVEALDIVVGWCSLQFRVWEYQP